MKLANTIMIAFGLASTALSYEMRTFTEADCEGDSKVVNVHDNTCRDSKLLDTKSFEVLSYGAHRQRAVVYGDDMCFSYPGSKKKVWWADGEGFKKGDCTNLDFTAKAFGSQSA